MKPTKWGVKVWVIAESFTGYVTNFQVYAGREGSRTPRGNGFSQTILRLSLMDIFYTGVNLLEEMKTHGLYACGTDRANRVGTMNRRKDRANQVPVVGPASLADYQKYMKGVDQLDQMVGYYGFQHRSKKWWRRVFFFFLAVSCHNAYIAARSVGGTTFRNKYRGYKSWLEDLAEQLITPLRTRAVNPPDGTSTLVYYSVGYLATVYIYITYTS
ncbi:uncharacterized protein LOC121682480 [Alosa sapidissima]|uniref:uncharacterized protein LOC121682480 n=1 Tax=Alosa sapidissima TaxID=34773 RepID=UPI001C098259|nr:uncharacterized protein LOC121682480 [Alosa sapidissima]